MDWKIRALPFVVAVLSVGYMASAQAADESATKPEKDKPETEDPADRADKTDKDREGTPDAEISKILEGVGYPELQVVPRASERLAMEARSERGTWFVAHWQIQLSALMTIYVGTSNTKSARRLDLRPNEQSDAQTIGMVTTAVGAGWLAGAFLLGLQKPYMTGAQGAAKIKGSDERSVLLRERLAEEAIERPAQTMRTLTWVSVITNATVNAISIPYLQNKGKITAGLGVILSFLPVLFRDHAIDVHEKQIEYKKKIYAPIKSASLMYDSQNREIVPMTNLVWTF